MALGLAGNAEKAAANMCWGDSCHLSFELSEVRGTGGTGMLSHGEILPTHPNKFTKLHVDIASQSLSETKGPVKLTSSSCAKNMKNHGPLRLRTLLEVISIDRWLWL